MIDDLNSQLEWLATLLGLAYVILAARHNLWAWPTALLSSALYAWLLWQDQLPMQALLHLVYVAMAIVGWFQWRQSFKKGHEGIVRMTIKQHLVVITLGTGLTLLIALMLSQYALSKSPWLDTTTSVFAIIVTWLVVKQRLENWLYWIIIDIVSALFFWQNQHIPMAMLYLVYTAIAVYGYWYWNQNYLKQKKSFSTSTAIEKPHPITAKAIIIDDKAL